MSLLQKKDVQLSVKKSEKNVHVEQKRVDSRVSNKEEKLYLHLQTVLTSAVGQRKQLFIYPFARRRF